MRCATGLLSAIVSSICILVVLSPNNDVVSCLCEPNGANVHNSLSPPTSYGPSPTSLPCVKFRVSLSTIGVKGDDMMLFVYWILTMTTALECLRIAGLVTFFHSDETNQCLTVDMVANVICIATVMLSCILMISWAERKDDCELLNFYDDPFSALSLLAMAISVSFAVALFDVISVVCTQPIIYSPLRMINVYDIANANGGWGGGGGGPGSITTNDNGSEAAAANTDQPPPHGTGSAISQQQGIFTIEDEGDSEVAVPKRRANVDIALARRAAAAAAGGGPVCPHCDN